VTAKARKKKERGHRNSRRAEAVTVAWTTSTIATAAAMAVCLTGFWLAGPEGAGSTSQHVLARFAPLMLFTGAVTGLVAFCLTPLVYISRRDPPPVAVTVFAVAVAISPLVALFWLAPR
jgi:uncharacterized membrane protein